MDMCIKLNMCKEFVAKMKDKKPEETEANPISFVLYCAVHFIGAWYMVKEAYQVQPQPQNPPNPGRVYITVENIGSLDKGS